MKLRRAVLAISLTILAICALGALSPAARADGDPGSDVLVYQNLFVAGDSNISIAQQVELGDLLTSASRSGFTIRVAVIATPADLGAVTQLWRKPTSYASFLGIELSLAYSQRLLVVMPDGFGFNWQGHSTAAAYQVLGKVAYQARRDRPGHVGRDGRAGARVRQRRPAGGARRRPGSGATGGGTAGVRRRHHRQRHLRQRCDRPFAPSGGHPATTPLSGTPVALIVVIAIAALAACALGGWLARRAGLRLAGGARAWLAGQAVLAAGRRKTRPGAARDWRSPAPGSRPDSSRSQSP